MRTIKTLGIATAMALALVAVAGASMASANYFKAAVEPETWNGALPGTQAGESHHLILGAFSHFSCTGVAFSGETKAKTLSNVTVTPELNKCAHVLGYPEFWKMNGCKFRFKPGPGPSLVGTMDITGCVEPMAYEPGGTCRTKIGNQNGLGTVTYENILVGGVPAVKMNAELTGITYTRIDGGCAEGSSGTFSNGTYSGEWIVKGASIPGGAAGVEIEAATISSPRFAAEEGPATLSGGYSSETERLLFDPPGKWQGHLF